MSCLSGAEIQIKLRWLEPTISSIPIKYCTIEPHLLIKKSRQYVNSLVTTVGGKTEVLFKDLVYTAPPSSRQRTEAQFLFPDWGDKVDFHSIIFIGAVS